MSQAVNLFAEALVAILLVASVITSIGLSRRIARLKADEAAMRKTVAELMTATESAERAIAGLRTTLSECDRTLADRLQSAERTASDLAVQVAAGETVMSRIAQIVGTSREAAAKPARVETPVAAVEPPAPRRSERAERLGAAVSAAQALAERAARRLQAQAA